MKDNDRLVKAISKIGEMLLENGAETLRVEDTMKRIALSYGATIVDSYATPSMIIISYTLDGIMNHNIKRTKVKRVDLDKIDKLNNLSRRVCKGISLDDFINELDKIEDNKVYNKYLMIFMSGFCAFGFAFVFNGGIKEAMACFVIGLLLKILMSELEKIDFVSLFNNIVGGAFVSFMALISAKNGFSDLDTVIIAADMLLVPGLAITNAIRDVVSGDLISGIIRALEAIIVALGIALGSAFILKLFGGF